MLKEGDNFSTEFKISQQQVIQFAEVSGDSNPLHLDQDFASRTVFKKPIIHGFLGGSVFSRVLGTEFPGEGTIYLKQSLEFLRPMFVEESYSAHFLIKEINRFEGKAVIETIIKDTRGKIVIKGEAFVLNKTRFAEVDIKNI